MMLNTNSTYFVANYYGSPGARILAHKAKNFDLHALDEMALKMAPMVSRLNLKGPLVPIPSRCGHAEQTLYLVNRIGCLTGLNILDIVKGNSRESYYNIKKQSVQVNHEWFGFNLLNEYKDSESPIIIDTVYDTGDTASAVAALFDHSITCVYARVLPMQLSDNQPD